MYVYSCSQLRELWFINVFITSISSAAVPVWMQYVQFAIDQMSVVPEGVAFPRDVCERAIISCGLHVAKVIYCVCWI